jgi:bifunctional non-homologous end joining protein LigD
MKVDFRKLPPARMEFIAPMLARGVSSLPSGSNWVYELKFDGYRTLVLKDRGVVTLFSRRGNIMNVSFPSMPPAFNFLPDNTMVDGELVVLDKHGNPSFNALQHSRFNPAELYFYAFDVVAYQGRDVSKLTLVERRSVLETRVLKRMHDPVRLSAVFDASPKELVAAAKGVGLEGVVGKRADSRYESGERSGAWVKYKTNKGQELVIGGYKRGTHGFEYLLVGYYQGRDLIFIAKIRNGFTPALRREIAAKFARLKTSRCPFANLPEPASARRGEAITAEVMSQIQWLRPMLVAQIGFTEWTKGNHLRHSQFVGLRTDKRPQDVVKEAG